MKSNLGEVKTPDATEEGLINVQVYRIEGDLVELLFYPRQVDLQVGETLTLHERDTGKSVIVQVIAFRTASYPSLVQEQMLNLLDPEPLPAPLLEAIGYHLFRPPGGNGRSAELGNIKVALAKIRKTVPETSDGHGLLRWEQWDGWIPARDVDISRTEDEEIFANATRDLGIACAWAGRWAAHRVGMIFTSKVKNWRRST